MVIRERRINLGQRDVGNLPNNLFGRQTLLVPGDDPTNGHSRAGNARTAATNVSGTDDEGADVDEGGHDLKLSRTKDSARLCSADKVRQGHSTNLNVGVLGYYLLGDQTPVV